MLKHRIAEHEQQKIHSNLNLYHFILQRSLCVLCGADLRHQLSHSHIFFEETDILSPVTVIVTVQRLIRTLQIQ